MGEWFWMTRVIPWSSAAAAASRAISITHWICCYRFCSMVSSRVITLSMGV